VRCPIANFSAFEIDEALLANMREYSLANTIYWALAEGHACEQSARRNAMDVCLHTIHPDPPSLVWLDAKYAG